MGFVKAGTIAQEPAILAARRDWLLRLQGLLSSLGLVWLAITTYRYLGYYQGFLNARTEGTLLYIAGGYTLYSLFFYALAPLRLIKESKGPLTFSALKKVVLGIGYFLKFGPKDYTNNLVSLTKVEKRALLFSIVKLFFVPLMISFLFGNYDNFRQNLSQLGSFGNLWTINGFNDLIYPLLFALFLLVDTAFFAFGYLFEASFLGNRVRSVDPTAIGWFVAIICYPPFNGVINGYTSWYASDAPSSASSMSSFLLKLAVLVLMGIYASASVALGPKASNLTNRGIVSYGPYKFVRHPAYISKNLAWWVSILPVISIPAILSMGLWSSIYFMRAVTEERHLAADPDYLKYCKKVKYRFIPGLV